MTGPVNNNQKTSKVEFSFLKVGQKSSSCKTETQKSIFNAIDANHDGVISKEEMKDVVKGKVKNKQGKLVEKEYMKLKDLGNGRSLVVDANGKQYVRAKEGVILNESYVKNGYKLTKSSAGTRQIQSQKTVASIKSTYANATKAFEKQLANDGWAGDLADGFSKLWNNDLFGGGTGNTASQVREELKAEKHRIQLLENAAKKDDATFKAQFKKIYGINYNQASIDAYNENPTEANYKKAFGTKIESIKTRIEKYNQSQQTGAEVVKTSAKVTAGIAVGVATGGAGAVALATASLGTAASSVLIEETDRMQVTGSYTDAQGKKVKTKGTFKEGTDHTKIMKNAAWDGAGVLAGGVVGAVAGKVVTGTTKAAIAGRAAFDITGDVAMGAAQEYAETGNITATGVLTNAAMSGVGSAISSGALKGMVNKAKKGISKATDKIGDNLHIKNSPKIQADVPSTHIDATSPKINTDAPTTKVETNLPKVDTDSPRAKVETNSPKVDTDTPRAKVETNSPKVDTDSPRAKVETNSPKVDTASPRTKVETNSPKVDTDTPRAKVETNSPKVDTDSPRAKVETNSPKVDTDTPRAKVETNSPKVDTDSPRAKVETNSPKVDTDSPRTKVETNSPKVDTDSPRAKVETNSPKVDTDSPRAKVETNSPKVSADAPNVKQSILGSVEGADYKLRTANLNDDTIQDEMLAMLEKEIPSTRRVPGRVKTLKELQTLVNSPDYAQMNDFQKQMAKIAIIKSNPRIDTYGLYNDLDIPIDMKRRLKNIECCLDVNGSPDNAASLYHKGDIETLTAIAEAKCLDKSTIDKMKAAYNKGQANGNLLVYQTNINTYNIPVQDVVKNGTTYRLKVIDCSNPATFDHPELFGLDAGTTADNMRLTVHMNDGFNTNPAGTIGRMRQSESINLSASVTNGTNTLYDNQKVGLILDYDMGSVSYASNYAAGTGFCKTNADFANSKLKLDESSTGTFIRERFVEDLQQQGIDFSIEDYKTISSNFGADKDIIQSLKKMSKDGVVNVNGKQVPLEKLEQALKNSTDDLIRTSYEMRGIKVENGFNEVNIFNPNIKAIYVRGNSADDTIESILSVDLLNYAQRRNLPIVFQRHIKSSAKT